MILTISFWTVRRESNRAFRMPLPELKLLLVADKTNCSPEFLEMIKDDIAGVVSKYMEIDSGEIEVGLTKTFFHGISDCVPVLYTNIPIRCLTCKGII